MIITTFNTEFVPNTDPNNYAVGDFYIDCVDSATDDLHLYVVSEGWSGTRWSIEDGVQIVTVYGDKPAPADGVVQFSCTEQDGRDYAELVRREEERYWATPSMHTVVTMDYVRSQRRTV